MKIYLRFISLICLAFLSACATKQHEPAKATKQPTVAAKPKLPPPKPQVVAPKPQPAVPKPQVAAPTPQVVAPQPQAKNSNTVVNPNTSTSVSQTKDGWSTDELSRPFNFDGTYTSGRSEIGQTNRNIAIASERYTFSGKSGTYKAFPLVRMQDNCFKDEMPLEVTQISGNRIWFTIKASSVIKFCEDRKYTFKLVKNGNAIGFNNWNKDGIYYLKEK